MKITIDVAKIFWFVLAFTLATMGLVSWWVVLLFALYGAELKYTFSS